MSKVTQFLDAHQTPMSFKTPFIDALHMWYKTDDKEGWSQWSGPTSLLDRQRAIGWKQMFQGFLDHQWRTLLIQSRHHQKMQQWLKKNEYGRANTKCDLSDDDDLESQYFVTFTNDPTKGRLQGDPSQFLSKLIRIIWTKKQTLWREHLLIIHNNSKVSSPDTHISLSNQV
jgi:hypothetical protein